MRHTFHPSLQIHTHTHAQAPTVLTTPSPRRLTNNHGNSLVTWRLQQCWPGGGEQIYSRHADRHTHAHAHVRVLSKNMHFACGEGGGGGGGKLGVYKAFGFRAGSARGRVNSGDGRTDGLTDGIIHPAALRGKKKRERSWTKWRQCCTCVCFFFSESRGSLAAGKMSSVSV